MDKLTMTEQEKERVSSFIREQKSEWDAKEQEKVFNERLQGKEYEPQQFPGYDEAADLQEVRNGWKSKLYKMFEKKAKKEGWGK